MTDDGAPDEGAEEFFEGGDRMAKLAWTAEQLNAKRVLPSDAEAVLLEMNAHRCRPPLEEDEVRLIAANVQLTKYALVLRQTMLVKEAIVGILREYNVQRFKGRCSDETIRAIAENVCKSPASKKKGGAMAGRYVEEKGCLYLVKAKDGQESHEFLANFNGKVDEEVVYDDGDQIQRELHIRGTHESGQVFPVARVPSEKFEAMNWHIPLWGGRATVSPNNSAKAHVRTAIQALHPDWPERRIYRHSGWRDFGGLWYYLHAGGAIGASGQLDGVEVSLEGRLGLIRLPAPPERNSALLHDAVLASLGLLDLGRAKDVGAVVLGGVYRAMLTEILPPTTAIWIEGPSGVFKSQLAGIAQAHYGSDFNGSMLPTNWSSTANAIERHAFVAKDALLVVDDFAPSGSAADVQRLHAQAERLIRGVGNNAGRDRLTAETKLRGGYHNRGFVLITGEDVPRVQSIKARLVIVSLEGDTIPKARLKLAQTAAAEGKYALAMSGFARWLAPRIDDLRLTFKKRVDELREQLRSVPQMHNRTPDALANLVAAWETFLEYAKADALLSEKRALETRDVVWKALVSMAGEQVEFTAHENPASRFVQLVRGALDTGRAFLTGTDGQQPLADAGAWGWTPSPTQRTLDPSTPPAEYVARGERIGVIEQRLGLVYLFPEAAYKVAHRFAAEGGEGISVAKQTLWKRLKEQGLLFATDEARQRNTVRRTIGGAGVREVLVLDAEVFGGPRAVVRQLDLDSFPEGTKLHRPVDPDAGAGVVSDARGVLVQVTDELAEKAGAGENFSRADALALATDRGVEYDEATRVLAQLVMEGVIERASESAYKKRTVKWS